MGSLCRGHEAKLALRGMGVSVVGKFLKAWPSEPRKIYVMWKRRYYIVKKPTVNLAHLDELRRLKKLT